MNNGPKNVWICGHSLLYWAESRAKTPEVGRQLGMDPSKVTIWWKGIQGMMWPQLLPQLHQLQTNWPNPDVLIIHLGGNDLSTESPTNLLASVKKDLTSIRSIFPQCALVWSNILPRRVWPHSPDSHEVDLVRTTVNRRIQNIVSELGGTSLSHENIRCGTNTGLYRADGIHLSNKGVEVFNLNLQDFLEKWVMEVSSEKSWGAQFVWILCSIIDIFPQCNVFLLVSNLSFLDPIQFFASVDEVKCSLKRDPFLPLQDFRQTCAKIYLHFFLLSWIKSSLLPHFTAC